MASFRTQLLHEIVGKQRSPGRLRGGLTQARLRISSQRTRCSRTVRDRTLTSCLRRVGRHWRPPGGCSVEERTPGSGGAAVAALGKQPWQQRALPTPVTSSVGMARSHQITHGPGWWPRTRSTPPSPMPATTGRSGGGLRCLLCQGRRKALFVVPGSSSCPMPPRRSILSLPRVLDRHHSLQDRRPH